MSSMASTSCDYCSNQNCLTLKCDTCLSLFCAPCASRSPMKSCVRCNRLSCGSCANLSLCESCNFYSCDQCLDGSQSVTNVLKCVDCLPQVREKCAECQIVIAEEEILKFRCKCDECGKRCCLECVIEKSSMRMCTGVHFIQYTGGDLWGWKHGPCEKRMRFCEDCAVKKLTTKGFGEWGDEMKDLLEMCGECYAKTTGEGGGLCGVCSKCDEWIIPVWLDAGFFECDYCKCRQCYGCGFNKMKVFHGDISECEECQVQEIQGLEIALGRFPRQILDVIKSYAINAKLNSKMKKTTPTFKFT